MSEDAPRRDNAAPELSLSQIARAIWLKLQEMRFALWLLMVLAAAGGLGSIIPQGETAEQTTERYGPALGRLITLLAFNRVFTSPWFLFLVTLLMLSLVACSRRLWARARSRWETPGLGQAQARFLSAAGTFMGQTDLPLTETGARLQQAAETHRFVCREVGETPDARWLHLARWSWAEWGIVLTHYSIFLVAIGAVMGALPGLSVDTYAVATEGGPAQTQEGELPFPLHLDSFAVRLLPDSDSVENYYSDVRLEGPDGAPIHRTLWVNQPVKHRGYLLTQVGWGVASASAVVEIAGKSYDVEFPVDPGGAPDGPRWVLSEEGRIVVLPDGDSAVVATRLFLDARLEEGKVTEAGSEHVVTPALALKAVKGFQEKRHDVTDLGALFVGQEAAIPGGKIKFTGVKHWSGIGVRKDPGVPLVWAGFIGSILGLMMIFYVRPVRATVRLMAQSANATSVAISTPEGAAEDDGELWRSILAGVGCEVLAQAPPREEAR